MKTTKRTAIGITLIVLIGLTSWGLAGTLTEQQYIDAGKAEYPRGNYDGAIYLFTAGLELNPDNPGLYNDRGLCYFAAGDKEKAIDDFSKAIELNPDFAEAYYNQGLVYFKKEKDKAIADFSKAIELDPNFVDAYYQRGLTYTAGIHHYSKLPAEPWPTDMEDRYERALADFNKVLELDPNYVLAYAGKGNLFYRYYDSYEEMQKAIAEYDKALESENLIIEKVGNKGLGGVYYSRGRAYTHLGELDRSESDYLKAIELDPYCGKALGHLAHLYVDIGGYSEALELCERYEEAIGRSSSHSLDFKMTSYYPLKEYDKAIETAEEVASSSRPRTAAKGNRYLGMICQAKGDEGKAREYFEKAINLSTGEIAKGGTKTHMAYYERGMNYIELKEYDKAISDFLKVIEAKAASDREYGHKNYYADAHINLVIAYLETGEKEKAREYFEKVVELLQRPGAARSTGK